MAPNRNPAARLYAPVEDQHRPQETPPVEQGQAVVLSHVFSPPAQVGVGTWCRRLVFPPSRGATAPARQTTPRLRHSEAAGRRIRVSRPIWRNPASIADRACAKNVPPAQFLHAAAFAALRMTGRGRSGGQGGTQDDKRALRDSFHTGSSCLWPPDWQPSV